MGTNASMKPDVKNPNSIRMCITGLPVHLKRELIEICEDECCSLSEFVKKALRAAINERKKEQGYSLS